MNQPRFGQIARFPGESSAGGDATIQMERVRTGPAFTILGRWARPSPRQAVAVLMAISLMPCIAQHSATPAANSATALRTPLLFAEPRSGDGSYSAFTPSVRARFLRDRVIFANRATDFALELIGSTPDVQIRPGDVQVTRINYLTGSEPGDWATDLATYGKLTYRGIYPGIDAQFTFSGDRLKSEFIAAPGADPAKIRFRYAGLGTPKLDEDGDLVYLTAEGAFREEAPRVFQQLAEGRTDVPARFHLFPDGSIGFKLGAFDRSLALIIDPVVSYSRSEEHTSELQ